MKFVFTILCFTGLCSVVSGQITVTTNPDTNQIRNQLQGGGMQIYNFSLFADTVSYGLFQGNSELPITSGFAITTGNVLDISGHSDSVFANTVLGHNNFSGWSEIVDVDSTAVYDYARLSFFVIPTGDTLLIGYCFASEEYLRCNDVGAIMITGTNPAGGNYDSLRLSWVATPNFPLCVVNCSQLAWQQYFIDYSNIPAQYESYSGGTVYFQREIAVVPGQPYYISFSVADATDSNYDSALMVERIWSDSTVAVLEHSDNTVHIFPNPVSEVVNFEFASNDDSRELVITNELGQQIWYSHTGARTISIPVDGLADGIYFYSILDSEGNKSNGKFVVAH